ncbi:MAG: TRAP transporter large permease subunit [Desulfobacteraceae bacterium]
MEWYLVLLVMFGGLFVLLSAGMPVAFSFLVMSLVGSAVYLGGHSGLHQLIYGSMQSVMSFTLLPVPLFIFMGELMFATRLGLLAIDTLNVLLGRLPGRLSLLSIGSGGVVGALCGSALASTALHGRLLFPEMRERGYSKFMSLGPIVTSGSLAMVIPPTALGVLLASLANVSVGNFLIGCIVPGILLVLVYGSYIVITCLIWPEHAPPYEVTSESIARKASLVLRNLLPMALIVFLVTVTIYIGVCTPSEAAALGAGGTMLLALLYRQLTWKVLREALDGTLRTTAMIFFILVGSTAFSQILAFSGAGSAITQMTADLPLSPVMLVICMQIMVIVLGAFMDQLSILMITLPIFMPIIRAIGFDDMVFIIMLLINVEMAGKTPPFGMSLFVIKGVVPEDVSTLDVYKSVTPFLLLDMVVMGLLLAFPVLSLWLPGLMG